MNFCSHCGFSVSLLIPDGDTHLRFVCQNCGTIHYQNPKIVVGAIPVEGDRILLCRRAIEPKYGFWTLPAGFMENNETTAQGAQRETWEEAGAHLQLEEMYSLVNVPHISQVHIFYRARLQGGYEAGTESLEIALFREEEIPWQEIAFRTVAITLQHFFADRKKGAFQFRTLDLEPPQSERSGTISHATEFR